MRKAYFHIGFGKTGSSSLQAYLSANPIHLTANNEKLLYCSFQRDGTILHGDKIAACAQQSPLKYEASFPDAAEWQDASLARKELDRIFEQGYTPIFSQEDWGRRAGHFKDSKLFDQLNIDVHAVVYVRPQVDWFNSAWWQWFAWSEKFSSPEDVIKAWGYKFMQWGNQITPWKRLSRVKGVTVRLQVSDIVKDFLELMGGEAREKEYIVERNNISLSPILIKLLKRYPILRSAHSADVDSILSRYLQFEGRPPWVLNSQLITDILDATREDNILLMAMLDPSSRELMQNDPRWWDADCFVNNRVWKEADYRLSENELLAVTGKVLPALIDLGRKQTSS